MADGGGDAVAVSARSSSVERQAAATHDRVPAAEASSSPPPAASRGTHLAQDPESQTVIGHAKRKRPRPRGYLDAAEPSQEERRQRTKHAMVAPCKRRPKSRSLHAWDFIEPLGMGVFGHVFAARDRVSGTISALKRIRNGPEHIRKVQAAMLRREMELLLECNHQNIVSLQAIAIEPIEEETDWAAQDPFVTQPSTTFLVLECLETDLRELSRSEEDGLDLRSALGATRQVASALEYIHARHIMHRDVKAANILYDCNEQRAVLCDFGMARRIDTDAEAGHLRTYTPDCTTLHYRAPEMLFGTRPGNYNATVDLWGLGCVLAEILLGETFLYGDDWTTQVQALLRVFGRPEQAEIDHLTRSSRINDVLIGTTTQSCSARAANLERTLVARAQRIGKVLPPIANEVFELLAGLLNPNPQQRFTAAVACTAATASEQGQARADQ